MYTTCLPSSVAVHLSGKHYFYSFLSGPSTLSVNALNNLYSRSRKYLKIQFFLLKNDCYITLNTTILNKHNYNMYSFKLLKTVVFTNLVLQHNYVSFTNLQFFIYI